MSAVFVKHWRLKDWNLQYVLFLIFFLLCYPSFQRYLLEVLRFKIMFFWYVKFEGIELEYVIFFGLKVSGYSMLESRCTTCRNC